MYVTLFQAIRLVRPVFCAEHPSGKSVAFGLFICPRLVRSIIFTIFASLCSIPSYAVDIPLDQHITQLTPHIEWLIDESNELTINDMRRQGEGLPFSLPNKPSVSRGSSDDGYWIRLRLTLVNKGVSHTTTHDRILELGFAALQQVSLYVYQDEQLIDTHHSGIHYPYEHRSIKHPHFAFPINLRSNSPAEIYIHIINEGPVSLPIKLWTPTAFMINTNRWHLAYGLYFGIMLGLAAYNLFLMLSTRDKSYLYYTCHIIGVSGITLGITGIGTAYIWGASPVISNSGTMLAACITHFFAIEFARSFLSTQKNTPTLEKFLRMFRWAFLFALPLIFILPKTTMITAISIVILVTVAVLLLAGINCYARGLTTARLFLVAWGVYELSTVIKVTSVLGWIPDNFFTFNATLFGSAIESVCLSFALADRINQMESEKQAIQRSALKESQKSNKLKDEFLSTISHELRTPMNGMEGALELLNTSELSEKDRECVVAALSSAENMTRLVDDVLMFSEIQSGNIVIENQTFSLRDLTCQLEADLQHTLKDTAIQYQVDSKVELDSAWSGDANKIGVILCHFLENGIKFSHRGMVSLKIAQAENGFLTFTVTDTGVGMSAEQIESIFQAFKQADGSHSRGYAGLGIGLSICDHLAKALGGTITVTSELNKGSQFTLSIPLTPIINHSASDAQTPVVDYDFTHLRLLIVEDNPVNQLVLAGMLNTLGVKTHSAFNGKEALKLLGTRDFDLCLMDCQMPVMDGYETTQAIRNASEPYSAMPIIAVTANVLSGDREKCLSAGMNDYIKKPVSLAILRETLAKWRPDRKNQALQA